MDTPLSWFALEVEYKKEKAVAAALRNKDFDCYLPVYNRRTMWSDRVKMTETPLFGGYVFCHIDPDCRRLPILVTPGVRQFVTVGGAPAPIPDGEIEAIRAVLRSGCPLEPCDKLEPGARVIVTRGSFQGVEGSFVRYQGRERLILTISLIQRNVAVEVDKTWVEPLSSNPQRTRLEDPLQRLVIA